jgi:ribosomal protein S18 acetylase RimI-like enzyme
VDHLQPVPLSGPGLVRPATIQFGADRLRVAPWQGHRDVALLGPGRGNRMLSAPSIRSCVSDLHRAGVARFFTPALSTLEVTPFLHAGFEVHERLHLLARDLNDLPAESPIRSRPGRAWHRHQVIEVDHAAFQTFWWFDTDTLREARRATPTSRYRVVVRHGRVEGYAITGRAGHRGYLQRLAVHPRTQGSGIGRGLVLDAFRWLARRGASLVMVNTQEANQRALDLYEGMGFVRQPDGLVVLSCQPRP